MNKEYYTIIVNGYTKEQLDVLADTLEWSRWTRIGRRCFFHIIADTQELIFLKLQLPGDSVVVKLLHANENAFDVLRRI